MENKPRHSARQVALGGLLFALSLLLAWLEATLAPLLGLPPGIKPGLANVVVMYALYFLTAGWAARLVVLKALFAFLVRGGAAGALSLSGGLCSLGVMLAVRFISRRKASVLAVSVAGAVSHNLGQLALASLWLSGGFSFAYAPVLVVSGVCMGAFTSFTLRAVLPALEKAGLAPKG
ncbi:MAG: Gx transporter family protein [Pygmaiobacter massiliensis]|nr:Gx transporter family protein [Pygmaiobacter massiliensis]